MRKKNRKKLREQRKAYRVRLARKGELITLVNKAESLLNNVFCTAENMRDMFCDIYHYQNIIQKMGVLYSIRLLQENGFLTDVFELPCAEGDAKLSDITPENLETSAIDMEFGDSILLMSLPGFEYEEIFEVDGDWSSENVLELDVLSEFSGTSYEEQLREVCSAIESEVKSGESYLTMHMLRNKQLGHFLTVLEQNPHLAERYPELVRFVKQCAYYMQNPYYESFIDYMAADVANNEWVAVFTVGYSSLWEADADGSDVYWSSMVVAILLKAILDKAETVIPELSLKNECMGNGGGCVDNEAA